jgi:ATP-dependent Clp protease ATP-binding subunit ClpA
MIELLPIATKIAREFSNIPGLPHAEFELAAQEALANASRRFDPAKGDFTSYAARAMRNALRDLYDRQIRHHQHHVYDLDLPITQEEKKKDSALGRIGRDLTELAAKGALPPLIGRRKEMLKITQILLQSRKNNLILMGEPGVGKTGIVEGFAQLLAEGKLPDALGRPAVIEISLTSLVGRNGPFRWLNFGVSPSRDKCGGHRRAATPHREGRRVGRA